jgi:hypothetical protein
MFRAQAASLTLVSTFSQSFPSAASSMVKSITPEFCRLAYRRAGPFYACRTLPASTRAWDNPTSVLSGADPSVGAISSGVAPSAVGGADGRDAEVCLVTTVAKDTSVTFFSIYPTIGMAAYADDDLDYFAPVHNGTVASGCAASVMSAVVFVYTDGGPICAISACHVTVVPSYDSFALGATIFACGIAAAPPPLWVPRAYPPLSTPPQTPLSPLAELPQWALWPS